MKANLPPFYVGQKVVCISTHPGGYCIKGQTYTIKALYPSGCGCSYWRVDIGGVNPLWETLRCTSCLKHSMPSPAPGVILVGSHRLRPIEQTNFPLMKFTEIKTREKEEILIPN